MVLLDSVVVNVRGENVVLLKLAPRTPHQVQTTFIWRNYQYFGASLVAQRVRRLPAMRETQVQSLGQEDSPGEGNGNPLQYPCLENSMDRDKHLGAEGETDRNSATEPLGKVASEKKSFALV